ALCRQGGPAAGRRGIERGQRRGGAAGRQAPRAGAQGAGIRPSRHRARRARYGALAGAGGARARRRSVVVARRRGAADQGQRRRGRARRRRGCRRRRRHQQRSRAMKWIAKLPPVWREAVEELWRRRLRTLLTLLGLIFGVGAIVAMQAVGEGSRREALKLVESLGLRN